jgi:indolepyruvate decarboxylase
VVFLLNNGGYTIERLILGARSPYNDVDNWRYAELPRVLDRRDNALSFVVQTVGELNAALTAAEMADRLVFIELKLPTLDAPALLKQFAHRLADFDYGEHGPRNPAPAVAEATQPLAAKVVDENV